MDILGLTIEKVEIYDIYGKFVLRHCERSEAIQIVDISHLSNGVYFLKINNNKIIKIIKTSKSW